MHHLKTLRTPPRYEDYKSTYWKGRRFRFISDASVKATHGNDIKALAPYIRNEDTRWGIQ
jgi:hypothetical protein